jgi:glycosyltransferase involved in cell wall biosynthesis
VRLLLDLQCVQSSSSLRGIGRYALCLSRALVATAGEHDVAVLLNGGDDPDRLLRARTALETFLPARDIHVFEAAWPFGVQPSSERRRAAEAARTAAVRSLRPDVVLVGSTFEGDTENVLSIDGAPASPLTAALLFDLIPAADPGTYLLGPGADDYWRRFEDLRRADLLLSISDYSASQAQSLMPGTCPPIVTVWGGPYPSGAFPSFEHRPGQAVPVAVPDAYLLTVGGDHPRKNLDRLVEAWGRVPASTRRLAPLVVACRLNVGTVRRLRRLARRAGVGKDELVLTGEVGEGQLAELYQGALAFVFPSTEEGLGMPPLEAMARGCPTLLARSSSLVELAHDERAFVDAEDVTALAAALQQLVVDSALRSLLTSIAAASAQRFTWEGSARLGWAALQDLVAGPPRKVAAAAPSPYPLVRLEDARATSALPQAPAAVHVGGAAGVAEQLERLSDDAVREDEEGAGLRSPAPAGVRTRLAPAIAFALDDPPDAAPVLVRAGLLQQPIVRRDQLSRAASHDPMGELAPALADVTLDSALAADVVRAAALPARWTLERPFPVVLVLSEAELPAEAQPRHAVIITGDARAASLCTWADHVVVEHALLGVTSEELLRARLLGAGIHVAVPDEGRFGTLPDWVDRAAPVAGAEWLQILSRPFDRRTGWPWRSGD